VAGTVETSASRAAMTKTPSHGFGREALAGVRGALPVQGVPWTPGCNHLPKSGRRGLAGVRHLPPRTVRLLVKEGSRTTAGLGGACSCPDQCSACLKIQGVTVWTVKKPCFPAAHCCLSLPKMLLPFFDLT